jgi:hypothetical protein
MHHTLEKRVSPAADAGERHPIRPLVLTVLLLAGFIGVLLLLALVVALTSAASGDARPTSRMEELLLASQAEPVHPFLHAGC